MKNLVLLLPGLYSWIRGVQSPGGGLQATRTRGDDQFSPVMNLVWLIARARTTNRY